MAPSSLAAWALVGVQLNSHNGSSSDGVAWLAIGFLVGLAFMYVGAKKWRVGRLIKNTPTEKIRSVAVGRTEVGGTCRDAGITYEQPYADGECVYRKWEVEEYHRNTGRNNDDNGSEWVTVGGGTDVAPFFVEDDTGRMLVDTTDAPVFEISDENSYTTTVDRGEDPPPEVASFSPESTSVLESFAGDVDPGKAMSKVPGMGAAGDMFGGQTISEMMSQEQQPDNVPSGEEAQKQFMRKYFDDEVLDENGQLREDVSEAELQAAMNDDMQGMEPGDMFGEMMGGGSGESGADGDGQSAGRAETDEDDDTEDGDDQQGPPDVVQELGGTGSAGSLGTGSSLGNALIDAVLHKVSGGRLGSSTGGGLIGSGSGHGQYSKRRYSHEVLPIDKDVYVFGGTTPRENASGSNAERLKLGKEELTGQFIVSDRSEGGIVKQYSRWGPLYVLVGLLVSAGSLGGLLMVTGIA